MPDAAPEIIYTARAKPRSWVREHVIDPHTPQAHAEKIMERYFWVTDRLEGKAREIAQKARPAVELSAKAAGWGQTALELYLAGSAVAITAILAGKGLKSAAAVFADMARRHGKGVAEAAPALLAPTAAAAQKAPLPADARRPSPVPPHVSPGRAEAFRRVSDNILKNDQKGPSRPAPRRRLKGSGGIGDWLARVTREALAEHTQERERLELMQTVGREASSLGKYLREQHPALSDEQRRHLQRAYVLMLEHLLLDNNAGQSGTDTETSLQVALEETRPRVGGMSNDLVGAALVALKGFIAQNSHTHPNNVQLS